MTILRLSFLILISALAAIGCGEVLIETFGIPALGGFEPKVWNDVLVSLFVVVSAIIIFRSKIAKNSRGTFRDTSLCVFAFYLTCRLLHEELLIPTASCSDIKYADITFAIVVIILLKIYLRERCKPAPKNIGNPFILVHDTPTSEIEERRKTVADTIVKAIRVDAKSNENIHDSYVINIDGMYGTGKSSLMKYIKHDILGKDDVVIDFYPWRYPSREKLIENFFKILSSALSWYFGSDIDNLLNRYVSAIIRDYGAYRGIANTVDELVNTSHDSNKLFVEIREKLVTLQKPIYIFLDDLDRLKSNEIWAVCYLIRDMANFPYLYFIIASDMEYVELMIGKELSGRDEANVYLKKIINLNIPLPQANDADVYKQMEDGIQTALSEKEIDSKEIVKIVESIKKSSTTKHIKKAFSDYREVKRFLSSLRFSLSAYPTKEFKENINVIDFIWLEIIKFKSPFMYKQLCADCLQLLTVSKNRYTLKDEVKDYTNKKSRKEYENIIATQISTAKGEILKKEINDLNEVYESQKEITDDLVYAVLNDLFYDISNYRELNSIQYINAFDNYFYSEISDKNLSLSSFLDIIQSPDDIYKSRIQQEVINTNKESSFYHNFGLLVQSSPNTIAGKVVWWLKRLFDCVILDANNSSSHQELLSEHSKITIILQRDLEAALSPFLSSHVFGIVDIENVIVFMKNDSSYISCRLFLLKLAFRILGHEYSYIKYEELSTIQEAIFTDVAAYINSVQEPYYSHNVQDIIKDCRSNGSQLWNKYFHDYLSSNIDKIKYWALGIIMWDKGRQKFFVDDLFVDTVIGSKNDTITYLDVLSQYDNSVRLLQKIIAEGRLVQGRELVDECPLLKEARYYE